MNPWLCASLITGAGGVGGVVNALLTDNGFVLPKKRHSIWCPGFITNVLIGAFAAFASWAFYGAGAGIDLAQAAERTEISMRFSALAGAFMIGVVDAKWITNEVDKRILKESVKIAGIKKLSAKQCDKLVKGSALDVLTGVEAAQPESEDDRPVKDR
jgi:hypothetical protein